MFTELVTTVLDTELCPTSAPFFGFMGVTSALVFASACARSRAPREPEAHKPLPKPADARGPRVRARAFSPPAPLFTRARPRSRARASSARRHWRGVRHGESGVGIASMGVMNPGLVMRNIIPVVMAGVLGIYGLIVAVILQGAITQPSNGVAKFSSFSG